MSDARFDDALARLDDALAHVPVAVIYGLAGTGKSALARAFAARWPDRVAWASSTSLDALIREVCRALGSAPCDDVAALADLLDRERALLIVEDLHAFAPAERQRLLAEASRELRRGRLLATSCALVPITVDDVDRLHLRLEPRDPETLRALAPSLEGAARAIAIALALSRLPLPHAVLAALIADAASALDALTTRLIVDRRADRTCAMHDLVRDAVLRDVPVDEQRAIRERLSDALQREPDDFVLEALPDEALPARLRVRHARRLMHRLEVRSAYELLAADCPDAGRLVLGNAAIWLGAWTHAEAIFDALMADPEARARAALGRAWVAVNRGTWTSEWIEPLQQLGVSAPYIESLRLCDALLRDAVLEHVDATWTVVEEIAPTLHEPWARRILPVLLGLVLTRAGELAQAQRLLATEPTLEFSNARAVLATERGDRIAQLAPLRDAIRKFDDGGFFAGRAWTRTVLARVLYQLGRRREATAVLDEVRALCAAHGTIAYQAGIAAAEREDPLHAAWLGAASAGSPSAKVRDALRAVEPDLESIEIPDGPDFALDRACLVLARALRARRLGQHRVAAQHLRRAVDEARAGEVDDDLVPALYDALASPADEEASPADAELIIDRIHHEIASAGRTRSLAARPVLRALLYAFADHPRHQLSNDELADVLWQTAYDPERHASTLKSNLRRLRDVVRELGIDIVREDSAYRLAAHVRMIH